MKWITCENTYEESWRRLLEYANVELAISAIEDIHGKDPANKANYKKQAIQARGALLQAKEYFEAAKSSSLFTQPNHIYYGAVALSTACMLIRGNGKISLDYLRKDTKNTHHGLGFTCSINSTSAKKETELLNSCHIEARSNGHFANWYNTLLTNQQVWALRTNASENGKFTSLEVCGNLEIPKFNTIINQNKSLEFMIKRIPDLLVDLTQYNIHVDFARGEHKINVNSISDTTEHSFIFHNSPSPDSLMKILDQFSCSDGVNFCVNIQDGKTSGGVKTRTDHHWNFSYPNSRTSLDQSTFFLGDDVNTPEVVDLFVISYALSMLSRYYPDIWVSFIESHCRGAKLVERIVQILILKLPVLMLNQMSNQQFIISTHRPHWY